MVRIALIFLIAWQFAAEAMPTSLYWTNCISDVEKPGLGLFGVNAYFTVFNKRGRGQNLPTDVSLLFGYNYGDLLGEIGIDYLGATDDPIYFNGKLGVDENKLFKHSPAVSLGFFNAGTRTHTANRTDQNVLGLAFGKSFNKTSQLYWGGFTGSRAMGKNHSGFWFGFKHSFCPAKDCHDTDYYKWVLVGDYASGRNTIGGGGIGVYYYFTPEISLITGPILFNDYKLNGRWKWTIQFYYEFPVGHKAKAEAAEKASPKKEEKAKKNDVAKKKDVAKKNDVAEKKDTPKNGS